MPIPKLGELRQLERADAVDPTPKSAASGDANVASTIVFALFGLIAVATLLAGGYCGIRWAALPTPTTMEEHIEDMDASIHAEAPAVMIREFESMEEYSLDVTMPYIYHIKAAEKAKWKNSALITGGIGLVSLVIAVVAVTIGRGKKQPA